MTTAPLGAADCEPLLDGVIAQPFNTLSSLAFLAAGAWVVAATRRDRPAPYALTYGAAVGSIGVGSFLYHGPAWPGSLWAHDLSLSLPAWVLLAAGRAGPSADRAVMAGALGSAVVVAVWPTTGLPIAVAVGVAAAGAWLSRRRRRLHEGAMRVAGIAGVAALPFQIWGRTGGPLCAGPVPAHAVWHVLGAVSLAALGRALLSPRRAASPATEG